MTAVVAGAAHARTLKIGITGTYAPYHFIQSDGKPKGIHYEILREATRGLGVEIQLIEVPRKRLEASVLSGEIDAFLNSVEWTEGVERFAASDPISVIEDVIFYAKKRPLTYTRPEDVIGKTLIAIRGYHYPPVEQQFKTGQTVRQDVKDELHALKMVDADRGDGALVVRGVGEWLIKNHKFVNTFEASAVPVTRAEFRLILAKKWQADLEKLNANLSKMKETGKIAAVYEKYLGSNRPM